MGLIHGFMLAILAGVCVGFCLWSLKWARTWRWENFWLVFAIFALIVVPFALAFSVLPHLASVYASLSSAEIASPMVLGLCWGFAQLGVGIVVHRLGFAVAGAILNGVGAAFGTVMPLILLHRDAMFNKSGVLILIGTAIMLLGVALCGWSGYRREEESKRQGRGSGFASEQVAMLQEPLTNAQYFLFVAMTVASGVLASLLSIALAYGGNIIQKVVAQGGRSDWAPFAIWPIALLGGSVVNIAYPAYLLTKNRTWGNFDRSWTTEIFYPVLAACLWFGGIAIYSSATSYLGALGISVGFGLYMTINILCVQFAAVITGEWSRMRAVIYRPFAVGIALLVIAVVCIGASNYVSN